MHGIEKEVCGLFKLGDRVLYGAHGVCEIVNIEQRRIERKNIEYFVLSPVSNAATCFYIPMQNEKALSKLTPLLSKEELTHILQTQSAADDPWIEDENTRKQQTKEVLASGNHSELIRWVKTMHIHRRLLLDAGKKFHQADDLFLKDAEKILITEFAIVLNVSEDSVRECIQQIAG